MVILSSSSLHCDLWSIGSFYPCAIPKILATEKHRSWSCTSSMTACREKVLHWSRRCYIPHSPVQSHPEREKEYGRVSNRLPWATISPKFPAGRLWTLVIVVYVSLHMPAVCFCRRATGKWQQRSAANAQRNEWMNALPQAGKTAVISESARLNAKQVNEVTAVNPVR